MIAKGFATSKLCLFLALNLADFTLTRVLMRHPDGPVYEGNPVAGWLLARFGWAGPAALKAAAVLLVAGIAVAVSSRRPRLGGAVLSFGCWAVAGVLAYSCAVRAFVGSDDLLRGWAANAERGAALDRRLETYKEYQALRARLAEEFLGGRRTLAEAAAELAHSEKGHEPEWLYLLRRKYPGLTDRQCLAANLAGAAVGSRAADPAAADRLARRLEADFRAAFGVPAPSFAPWEARPRGAAPPARRLPLPDAPVRGAG